MERVGVLLQRGRAAVERLRGVRELTGDRELVADPVEQLVRQLALGREVLLHGRDVGAHPQQWDGGRRPDDEHQHERGGAELHQPPTGHVAPPRRRGVVDLGVHVAPCRGRPPDHGRRRSGAYALPVPVRPSSHLTRRGRLVLALATAAALAGAAWGLTRAPGETLSPAATASGTDATTASPSPSPSPAPPLRVQRAQVEAATRWVADDLGATVGAAAEGLLATAPVVVVADGPMLTPARGVAWRLHAPLLPQDVPDLDGLLDRLTTTTVVQVVDAGATSPPADLGGSGRDVVVVEVAGTRVDRTPLDDVVVPERPVAGTAPLVLVRTDDPARPLLDTIALAGDVPLVPVTGELARDQDAVARLQRGSDRPWAVAGTTAAWSGTRPQLLAWDVEVARSGVELPGGGLRMFPGRQLVAMYGSPNAASLGILGEQPVGAAVDRARSLAADYAPLVDVPVVPTFEIIVTVASGAAGTAGDYSIRVPHDRVQPWIDAAAEAGIYVVLDLQPGRTDFLTQAKEVEPLLRHPHVGLALDPEWRLRPDQVHLRQVGSVGVEEVQAVADWLADLTRARGTAAEGAAAPPVPQVDAPGHRRPAAPAGARGRRADGRAGVAGRQGRDLAGDHHDRPAAGRVVGVEELLRRGHGAAQPRGHDGRRAHARAGELPVSHPVTAAPTLDEVRARIRTEAARSRTIVLVEGASDRAALLALAARQRRDLAAAATSVVVVGGAGSFGHALDALARAPGVRVVGLCDAGEEAHLRRALARTGVTVAAGARALADRGFFVCVEDLEDELVRALGTGAVLGVVASVGELASYRRFCAQPAQRSREEAARLRRFIGTRSGRKVRYAAALCDALPATAVPRPLQALLDHV